MFPYSTSVVQLFNFPSDQHPLAFVLWVFNITSCPSTKMLQGLPAYTLKTRFTEC